MGGEIGKSFAVVADIHGNVDALLAVLDDIGRRGISSVANLGDHLSGPLAARETADILLRNDFTSIRGNHDRWLVTKKPGEMGPSDAVAHAQLEVSHRNWLGELPARQRIGSDIFLCHGTPTSDVTYWLETVDKDGNVRLRPRSEIELEAAGVDASLILCGHTHIPRRVDLADGRVILNPGSVGCPGYDDDHPVPHVMQAGTAAACYATVERSTSGWVTSFHHVPYDASRMVRLAEDAGRPEWACALRSGWVR